MSITTKAQPTALYIVGLDLGQAADPSALAVLEQTRPAPEAEASYGVRELRRWPLGTPYPAIVADVIRLCAAPPLVDCELVIDGTGCGRAVVDLFRCSAIRASCRPVLITAGHAVSRDEHGYTHVAKVQLVSTTLALGGAGRLRFAKALPLRPVVEKELQTFRAKITNAGNETFQADWREGAHDDLVLAVALAAWVGENVFIGPFAQADDPGNRTLTSQMPPGIFRDRSGPSCPEDGYVEEYDRREAGERDNDGGKWPW